MLTINATTDSRGYDGTTDSAATPTVVGTVYSPDTVDDLVQVFDSRNAGARTLTASYTVNDGNGGGNYNVTANTASGSIDQALLTIDATTDSRGYDGTTDSAATPTVVGTVYAPDTVTGLDQVFDSRNAGDANPDGVGLHGQRRQRRRQLQRDDGHGERDDQPGIADDQRDDRQPRVRRHDRFGSHADGGRHGLRAGHRHGTRPGV